MTKDPSHVFGFGPGRPDDVVLHSVLRRSNPDECTPGERWAVWRCAPDVVVHGAFVTPSSRQYGRQWCRTCRAGEGPGRRVYVAELVNDVIKVGCSNNLRRRMNRLGGRVLASCFGDFPDETDVLARIATPPLPGTREYFPAAAKTECLTALHSLVAAPTSAVPGRDASVRAAS